MDVITTHINADFDAVGSMVAAKKLYPEATLVYPGGEEKTIREFFIQSTLYSLNIETLRSIDLDRITRLVVVDTRQPERIGKFASIIGKPGVTVHVYDHHPDSENDIRGDVEVTERTGACVTLMTKILQKKGIDISEAEATIMALGIHEDTGSLTFASTTPDDYRAAGYLLEKGANLATVSDIMSQTLTKDQIFVLADLIRNMHDLNVKGHRVTVTEAIIPQYTEELAVAVNRMREIESLDAVFALIQSSDRIYLIARASSDAFDVSQVAKHFGGGGHPYAAAATIKDRTIVEAREDLYGCLYSILRGSRNAASLMSYPVKTIDRGKTIAEASDVLIRYNVNVLPVMDDQRVAGYITRAVVFRATHHGLQNSPVEEFMTADVLTAGLNTPFTDLYNMIVGRKQRLVPVVAGGTLAGVITRTDILNHLLDERTAEMMSDTKEDRTTRPAHVRDLSGLLADALPDAMLEACRTIGKNAEELGMTAYLVGGFVRDLILRQATYDLDIVVEGDGIELASRAAAALHGSMAPHAEFKTATLTLPADAKIDFATARLEYYEHPAALPIVEASSIKLDMMRRDFTINTLVICINPDRFGEMVDFFGAYQDLKDGNIRVLHNLSFIEDPTRICRAVRFEQRFGFEIGKHTLKLLKSAVKAGFLDRVEGKRVMTELRLILEEKDVLPILKRLDELRVLECIHRQLKLQGKNESLLEEVEGVLSWYDFLYLDEPIDRYKVWLFGLAGYIKQKDFQEILVRLGLQEKQVRELGDQKMEAETILHRLAQDGKRTNSMLYHIMSPAATETLLFVMAKSTKDSIRKAVSHYLSTLQRVDIDVGGSDLIQMGFTPGPIFSEILGAVLDARLDGKVLNKEQERAFILGKFNPEG